MTEKIIRTRRITINVPRFTVADLAKHVQMSRDFIKRQIKTGKLEAAKIGNRWRISNAAVHRWLANHPARLGHVMSVEKRKPLTIEEALCWRPSR